MKKRSILLVACIISAGIYMAYAEKDESRDRDERREEIDRKQHERGFQEQEEREHREMEERERAERHEMDKCASEQDIAIFDKNIRLDFQAIPLDKDDKGTFIVTATSHFQLSVRLAGEGYSLIFNVSGNIMPLEDDKIFVIYEVHTIVEGKDGEAMFHLESGVLVKLGKDIALGTLGDKTLMLKASYLD